MGVRNGDGQSPFGLAGRPILAGGDSSLEAAIDRVGRERVFERARELGWGNATPPKWVWQNILAELSPRPGA